MDDNVEALIERYRDLTTRYEHAVHDTYMTVAWVGPHPAASLLLAWRDAVTKEDELKRQREDLYLQVQYALAKGE